MKESHLQIHSSERNAVIERLQSVCETGEFLLEKLNNYAPQKEIQLLASVITSAAGMQHMVQAAGLREDTLESVEALERHLAAIKQKYPKRLKPVVVE